MEQELLRVQALMQLEQKEDLAQFKLKSAKVSIQERQKRGLTWYPVTITNEDTGFGGTVVLELERARHAIEGFGNYLRACCKVEANIIFS